MYIECLCEEEIMKFFVLTGALINAGDFLITERTKQLLEEVYPNCEVVMYNRKKAFTTDDIELANSCDAIVYAGGPCVKNNLYPNIVPLVPDLDTLSAKIVSVGLGWGGATDDAPYRCTYSLSDSTKQLFARMERDASIISCRDYYTCSVLKNNGIAKATMTGCPAWYNIDWIKNGDTAKKNKEIKKICISEPANLDLYYEQCIELCKYVKSQFPQAELKLVIHRAGEKAGNYVSEKTIQRVKKLKQTVENIGFVCEDISYGYEKIKVYDDCDLHIGYRVHAHIYNLSRGGISVLLEEDARGAGVNDALNLRHIKAYNKKIMIPGRNKILNVACNKTVVTEVDDWINRMMQNNCLDYVQAHNQIKEYYQVMSEHIKSFV